MFKMGNVPHNKGKRGLFYHTEEQKKKIGIANRGRIGWNRGLTKETDNRILKHSEAMKNWNANPFKKGFIGDTNGRWLNMPKTKVCRICGKAFNVLPSRIDRIKVCSRTCSDIWHSKTMTSWINNPFKKGFKGVENGRWNNGSSFEPYSFDFNNQLKHQIRKRNNYECYLCGIPENGKALSVHHIDYNKKNNLPLNLIALCGKCHSKTNSKREFWTECFRERISRVAT